jgi:Fur family transcriptional regulator, stress-responsive regulator
MSMLASWLLPRPARAAPRRGAPRRGALRRGALRTAGLRTAGLRVTLRCHAVLTWLAEHPHSTAGAIGAGVREQVGAVPIPAVYDVLAACTGGRLLQPIEPAGHAARFERHAGDNHHYIVCRRCGRAEDADCVAGARPCLTLADEHGFAVDGAEVVFWGASPSCTAAGA